VFAGFLFPLCSLPNAWTPFFFSYLRSPDEGEVFCLTFSAVSVSAAAPDCARYIMKLDVSMLGFVLILSLWIPILGDSLFFLPPKGFQERIFSLVRSTISGQGICFSK